MLGNEKTTGLHDSELDDAREMDRELDMLMAQETHMQDPLPQSLVFLARALGDAIDRLHGNAPPEVKRKN